MTRSLPTSVLWRVEILPRSVIYRSASPVIARTIAHLTRQILWRCGVLSWTTDPVKIQFHAECGLRYYWHRSLYDAGNVAALDLNANYRGGQYAHRLAAGLRRLFCIRSYAYSLYRVRIVRALSALFSGTLRLHLRRDARLTMVPPTTITALTRRTARLVTTFVVDVKFDDIARCIAGVPTYGSLDGADYAAGARKYLMMAAWRMGNQQTSRRLTNRSSGLWSQAVAGCGSQWQVRSGGQAAQRWRLGLTARTDELSPGERAIFSPGF